MKLLDHPSAVRSGNILLAVMITLGITFVALGLYLAVGSQRNIVSVRSSVWNNAMPVAEAGIEEGLTQVQYSLTPSNGWTLANGWYSKTRTSPFGDTNSYFTVLFQPNAPPTIIATGYVRAPMGTGYINRTVQVTTKQNGQYPYGMLSKGLITISGGSKLDSFASCDPNYSTGGKYDSTKAQDQIKVASDSSAIPAIKVGTGKIYGYAGTGALGTVTYGSGGSVGDSSWVSSGMVGGELGHISNDINIAIPDISPPYSFANWDTGGPYTINGTNYTYVLGQYPSNYVNGNLSISGGQAIMVTNPTVLYVTGSFTISGSGYAYIAPGGSLALYVGTTNTSGNNSITVSGGGIANGTGIAANFAVYGLPSVKTTTFSGSAQFIGTSYTPEANLTLSGSADGSGAVVANTITLSGGMNFHYDSCLGGQGNIKYLVNSWREL